ncbi:Perchlorate reductase subunit gamma precursor [Polystyrenella longa]|uniref:Perchlorate reductase subunit gamma n=1 Tax=Polystyrenella longa TaxID=2528007 RepID=A0A518CL17_9PLAN|nr:multiheme c-type cytochrome [Polystyrenella longa]QDU79925.1 Perchlorate reductase subunit gamma precursor [Polystyrenella longa]
MVNFRVLPVLSCLVLFSLFSGCDSTGSSGSPVSNASGINTEPDSQKSEETDSGADETTTATPAPVERPPKPILEGWEKPAVAFILSGEQNGYLEPCGCSDTQSGGMARRADLFAQLKSKDWPLTALDVGGFLRHSRRQSQLKMDAIFNSLTDLEYAATGIGPSDIAIGSTKLLERGMMEPGSEDQMMPQLVSANVTLFNDPELGAIHRTRVYEVNGVKIGVTGVIGESVQQSMLQSSGEEVQVLPVEETLPLAVEELKAAEADLYILLSFSETEESQKLAEQYELFDVVLTARSAEDPDPRAIPIGDSGRLLVKVGQKGKNVGVLGYYPDEEEKLRWELIDLDNRRFESHPSMAVHMQSYQDNIAFEDLAKTEPTMTHSSGNTFIGARSCRQCHSKAYAKWESTKHSHAFDTLKKGHEGDGDSWIPRVDDPECLSCHVVGWEPQEYIRFESGFINEELTPDLKGQQCENCHGPASQHVKMEAQWLIDRDAVDKSLVDAARKELHLDVKTAEKQVCSKCHDHENSPKFNFEEYWEKVKHPYRD